MRFLAITIGLLTLAPSLAQLPDGTQTTDANAAAISTGDAIRYQVVPTETKLRILVYRDGPFAGLGHNHVVLAQQISGSILLREPTDRSTFELLLPIAHLLVDDQQARDEEGPAFSSEPSATDIKRTRENMLGPRLLDHQRFPTVRIVGGLAAAGESASTQVEIHIRESVAQKTVPIDLSITDDRLTIQGDLEISHSELGLEPFSVMMGAIRVAEVMKLRFEISALRQR
jgi:hypothetical protein